MSRGCWEGWRLVGGVDSQCLILGRSIPIYTVDYAPLSYGVLCINMNEGSDHSVHGNKVSQAVAGRCTYLELTSRA